MNTQHHRQHLAGAAAALLSIALLATPAAALDTDEADNATAGDEAITGVNTPTWLQLEFNKQQYGIEARTLISLDSDPDNGSLRELSADSSIARNAELLQLNYSSEGQVLSEKSRLSQGTTSRRLKHYSYYADHLIRQRREPGFFSSKSASEWPLTSEVRIPYPPGVSQAQISAPYALLMFASTYPVDASATEPVIVHVDHHFYAVRLVPGTTEELEASYQLDGQNQPVEGKREIRRIALEVSPLGTSDGESEFSLLGLESDIVISIDTHSGLPLRIEGNAPRVGHTSIDLHSARLASVKPAPAKPAPPKPLPEPPVQP